METLICSVPHSIRRSKVAHWIEQSRSTPSGLEIVEGPLVRLKNDPSHAIAQVLCHEVSSCETTMPIAALREMTEHDALLCEKTTNLETQAREHAFWKKQQLTELDPVSTDANSTCHARDHFNPDVQYCEALANPQAAIEGPPSRKIELLEAKYKKEGRKEK